MEVSEERVYNELKALNISQIRGEAKLTNIDEKFAELNGSVKKHEIRIGGIEKKIYIVIGALGMISIFWTIFMAFK